MTMPQITAKIRRYKPMTIGNIYAHMRVLGIRSLGVARPARYPDDAAERILIRLGFKQPKMNGRRTGSRRQLQKETA